MRLTKGALEAQPEPGEGLDAPSPADERWDLEPLLDGRGVDAVAEFVRKGVALVEELKAYEGRVGLLESDQPAVLDAMEGMAIAVTWFGVRLQRGPDRMLGRVVALTRMVAFTAIPVAAVVSGLFLAATRDFALLIAAAAAIQIVLGSFGALGPMNARDDRCLVEAAA